MPQNHRDCSHTFDEICLRNLYVESLQSPKALRRIDRKCTTNIAHVSSNLVDIFLKPVPIEFVLEGAVFFFGKTPRTSGGGLCISVRGKLHESGKLHIYWGGRGGSRAWRPPERSSPRSTGGRSLRASAKRRGAIRYQWPGDGGPIPHGAIR